MSALRDRLVREEHRRVLDWLSRSELKSLQEAVRECGGRDDADQRDAAAVMAPYLRVAELRRALDYRGDCVDHLAARLGPVSLPWRRMRVDCRCVARLLADQAYTRHLERSLGPADGNREAWLAAIREASQRVHARQDVAARSARRSSLPFRREVAVEPAPVSEPEPVVVEPCLQLETAMGRRVMLTPSRFRIRYEIDARGNRREIREPAPEEQTETRASAPQSDSPRVWRSQRGRDRGELSVGIWDEIF
jgi:hypothetical protein